MLLANGDLAFKGYSTNCSVGLNFWSENLLSAGDITGEASLSPLLPSIRADRAALSPVSKGKQKQGKHTKKTHLGAPNKTCGWWWLRGPGWSHLLPVGFWWYLAWGVAAPVALPLVLDAGQATAPAWPPSAGDSLLPRICSWQSLSCRVRAATLTPLPVGDCGQCQVGCYGSGVPKPFAERARTWRLKAAPVWIGIGTTGRRNMHWGNRLLSRGFGSWAIAPGLG